MAMTTALVAFATRNGSTKQVAEDIAETLCLEGITVECRPARDVREPLRRYDLVVLGAPLYNGRWHRDARRFLKRHRTGLPPIAVFGVGPRTDHGPTWLRAREQLDRSLSRFPWITPTTIAVFGGVDPPGRRNRRDLRDWVAIRTWTHRLTQFAARHTPPSF
ncbi:flavodoxin [Thermopolyspora flexuosa]|jgi:menaquinone-dependent protoporphyrinogen oxidase|uniref:Menaquinone-dependent protoporphyrinogen oxidase n=2 Tax=Thermopolyspora flexuosa TaxID=103836 RepID=A0A543J1S4_9ACTN|nr:menaquinone-dependent protoporphyrinogen oxidase [Thermopolyspora flexuosa]GGM86640.1 flavodoxin [Thermopolyspora flexuosa]